MNTQPHVHNIVIQREYPDIEKGRWEITYGDTKVRLGFWFQDPRLWSKEKLERKVAKCVREVIAKHDAGSKALDRSALDELQRRHSPKPQYDPESVSHLGPYQKHRDGTPLWPYSATTPQVKWGTEILAQAANDR